MGNIVVDIPWLQELRTDMSATHDRMTAASDQAVSLPSRPNVHSDTTDFMNRWDERRGDLAECLGALDDILGTVIETFEFIDQALANATTPGGVQ